MVTASEVVAVIRHYSCSPVTEGKREKGGCALVGGGDDGLADRLSPIRNRSKGVTVLELTKEKGNWGGRRW
jgi:hypothetical protein